MKAEKTMHLVHETINQILGYGKHLKTESVIQNHLAVVYKEIEELERLAEIGEAVIKSVEEDYRAIEFKPYAGAKTQYFSLQKEELDDIVKWYQKNYK